MHSTLAPPSYGPHVTQSPHQADHEECTTQHTPSCLCRCAASGQPCTPIHLHLMYKQAARTCSFHQPTHCTLHCSHACCFLLCSLPHRMHVPMSLCLIHPLAGITCEHTTDMTSRYTSSMQSNITHARRCEPLHCHTLLPWFIHACMSACLPSPGPCTCLACAASSRAVPCIASSSSCALGLWTCTYRSAGQHLGRTRRCIAHVTHSLEDPHEWPCPLRANPPSPTVRPVAPGKHAQW
jgi:hypothetical protein